MTGPQGRSKALLVFQWLKMPKSTWTETLHKNQSGTNVDCMEIQQNPITFTAAENGEKVALNIAHSGYILDKFDSYFIFDGPDTSSPVVGRMNSHVVVPFIPSNQSVTIIGLTKQVVYSNIIANIKSNIGAYRKYQAAVVIDQYGGQLDSINQTIAVTFIAKDANQLYITYLKFNEIENEKCEMRIISGTPSPISNLLLIYTPSSPLNISFPQQFPASQFTAELSDCSVYMVITKNTPVNFNMVTDERIGYVFTPSFLDSQQTPFLNFTLNSNETRHFSTTVESVKVYNKQILAINVMNSKGISTMSAVVTGNETGGSAEGIGNSVNINFSGMTGQGQAKIRYHISKISGEK
uniref:IgGFc_binding domain-containing protein n=1 Tax=Caenorhabditis tropicalis TaxID=1561998 RepID=A0A1I7T805_9PELO